MGKFVFLYRNGKYAKGLEDADSVLDARVYETIDPHRTGGAYLPLIPTLEQELQLSRARVLGLESRLSNERNTVAAQQAEVLIEALEQAAQDLTFASEKLRRESSDYAAGVAENDATKAREAAEQARAVLS